MPARVHLYHRHLAGEISPAREAASREWEVTPLTVQWAEFTRERLWNLSVELGIPGTQRSERLIGFN